MAAKLSTGTPWQIESNSQPVLIRLDSFQHSNIPLRRYWFSCLLCPAWIIVVVKEFSPWILSWEDSSTWELHHIFKFKNDCIDQQAFEWIAGMCKSNNKGFWNLIVVQSTQTVERPCHSFQTFHSGFIFTVIRVDHWQPRCAMLRCNVGLAGSIYGHNNFHILAAWLHDPVVEGAAGWAHGKLEKQ